MRRPGSEDPHRRERKFFCYCSPKIKTCVLHEQEKSSDSLRVRRVIFYYLRNPELVCRQSKNYMSIDFYNYLKFLHQLITRSDKEICLSVTNVSTRLKLRECLRFITTICTRIYKIYTCGHQTSSKRGLISHQKAVHEERKFSCVECNILHIQVRAGKPIPARTWMCSITFYV